MNKETKESENEQASNNYVAETINTLPPERVPVRADKKNKAPAVEVHNNMTFKPLTNSAGEVNAVTIPPQQEIDVVKVTEFANKTNVLFETLDTKVLAQALDDVKVENDHLIAKNEEEHKAYVAPATPIKEELVKAIAAVLDNTKLAREVANLNNDYQYGQVIAALKQAHLHARKL